MESLINLQHTKKKTNTCIMSLSERRKRERAKSLPEKNNGRKLPKSEERNGHTNLRNSKSYN